MSDDFQAERPLAQPDVVEVDTTPPSPTVSPWKVKTAGFIWSVYGGTNLFINFVWLFGCVAASRAGPGAGRPPAFPGECLAALLLFALAVAFAAVGLRTLRGTASEPVVGGTAPASLVVGVLQLAWAAFRFYREAGVQEGVGLLAGVGIITAGILALLGRADYRAWQQARKRRRQRKKGKRPGTRSR